MYSKLLASNARETGQADPGQSEQVWAFPTSCWSLKKEIAISEYLRSLWRRKWFIVVAILTAVTLVTAVSLHMTPVYDGVARIAIYRDNLGALNVKDSLDAVAAGEDSDYTVTLDTQAKIMEGDNLDMEVIRRLLLDKNPDFVTTNLRPSTPNSVFGGGQMDTVREGLLLETFRKHLKVRKVPHTRLLEIHFSSPDPKLAALVANTLANAYIEHNFHTKYDSTMQVSERLSKELVDLKQKVDSSQEALVQYQKEHGILGVDEKQNIVTAKLDELNRDLTAAAAERMQKEAQYRLVTSSDVDSWSQAESSTLLPMLRSRESDLGAQLAQATSRLGPSHPRVVELVNQIKNTDGAIAAELLRMFNRIQNAYLASVQHEKLLRKALEDQIQQANRLNESAIEYGTLKHEADTNRQLYEGLQQKLKEARVAAVLKSTNVWIEETSRVPAKPIEPNIPTNIGWGLFAGLMGGLALVVVLENLDDSIRTPEQAEAVSALPTLGIIPASLKPEQDGNGAYRKMSSLEPRRDVSIELISYLCPTSSMAESYRVFRSLLLLGSYGKSPRVIVFTSALPREGKTTTAVNAAIVLAQRGERVLLVDADFRNPAVHRVLGVTAKFGLAAFLNGDRTLAEVVYQSSQKPTLFILPTGPNPASASELLSADAMKRLIVTLRQDFDFVIIDTPPVLAVPDVLPLAVEADAVLLVVRAANTTRQALHRSCGLLMKINAPVAGIIVNALTPSDVNNYHYGYVA